MTQRGSRNEFRPVAIPWTRMARAEPPAAPPGRGPAVRGIAVARPGVDKQEAEPRAARRLRAQPVRRKARARNSIRAWWARQQPRLWPHRAGHDRGLERVWPGPFFRVSAVSRPQVLPCECGRRDGGASFRPQRRRQTVYRRQIWEGGPCRDFRIIRRRARAASDAGAQAKFQAATRALAKQST